MKADTIKSALLEYLIRALLKSCGFTNVQADKLYSFERGDLLFVNGKGAAHDVDIIMNPPVQMPFAHPVQLLFECKASDPVTNMPFIRSAIGLKNDLNGLEVVTTDTLMQRQNGNTETYALDTRTRFFYQVGVASVNDFSPAAIECAANYKIPLLSLSWFLDARTVQAINSIESTLLKKFSKEDIQNLYRYCKDRKANLDSPVYKRTKALLDGDNIFNDIVIQASKSNPDAYVGLLETGDMVFLCVRSRIGVNILNSTTSFGLAGTLKAEIHFIFNRPNVWKLTAYHSINREQRTEFDLYVSNSVVGQWKQFNIDKSVAGTDKQNYFSRLFIFNQRNSSEVPFSIINIDMEWLERIRQEQILKK